MHGTETTLGYDFYFSCVYIVYQFLCVNWWTGFTSVFRKDLRVGGWGLEIPFLERIEKPVRKNGPPLTVHII